MDETLIHTIFRHDRDALCLKNGWVPSFEAVVPFNGPVRVYKRPGLDAFIAELSRGIAASEYEVVVFTAVMQHYTDVVLDKIDLLHCDCPHHAALAAKRNGGSSFSTASVSRPSPFQLETALYCAKINATYGKNCTRPRRPAPPAITESVLHHRLYREATITHGVDYSETDLELRSADTAPQLQNYPLVKELGRLGRDLGSYFHPIHLVVFYITLNYMGR